MSRLAQIGATAQQAAEAIASVLGVEVTIVDETLRRIAGTGRYQATIGAELAKDSVFAQVLKSSRSYLISNPGEDSACTTCEARQLCTERAQACCPVTVDGQTVGVIALIAFTDRQRQTLLDHRNDLAGFLSRMAELLAGKIAEKQSLCELEAMKNQLETVINTVQEGIVAFDSNGRIVNLNASAARMLGIQATEAAGTALGLVFAGLPLEEVLQGREIVNREFSRLAKGRRQQYLVTVKPWFESGRLRGAVATLREMAEVRRFVSQLSNQTFCYTLDMILGSSQLLKEAKAAAAKAAAGSTTVLIQGGSGTGKELFARAIHCGGERRDKPFVAVNCAAIPEALLESELFGYEEGAFTGARRGGKPGKFELADGGTLFLDEIGDMSLVLQAKLLRVLQERCVERVGGLEPIAVDVRIIAATHKNIEAMVQNGEFRSDLYYRINVFPLYIPSLHCRREDILPLAEAFLAKYCAIFNKDITLTDDSVREALLSYDWPGNVRELENIVEYLVNVETSSVISFASLPQRIRQQETGRSGLTEIMPLAELEKTAIGNALARFGTSTEGKGRAAEALGISKATLYRKLKEYEDNGRGCRT